MILSAVMRIDKAASGRVQDPKVKRLLDEHNRLNVRIEELEHELGVVQSSRSWRLTSPFRLIKPFFGYLRSIFAFAPHLLSLRGLSHLTQAGEYCTVVGNAPHALLSSSRRRMPVGWIRLRLGSSDPTTPRRFVLYFDDGEGFSEKKKLKLSFEERDTVLIKLPRLIRDLRIDFVDANGRFHWGGIIARELSGVRVIFSALLQKFRDEGAHTAISLGKRFFSLFSMGGSSLLWHELLRYDLPRAEHNKAYLAWVRRYDRISERDRATMRNEMALWKDAPTISIIMPVYNTPERWLRAALDSVLRQIYPNWELCVADDASTRPHVRAILHEYAARDKRLRVISREQNGHISEASNSALALASGEYVALIYHDDELSEQALYCVAKEIVEDRSLDLIYSDEDRITERGERIDPYFKPDWDENLLLGQNFISHLGVYRASLARSIGGFRRGYEGSQDWDFTLRFVEQSDYSRIKHVAKVLYHWRDVPSTVSFTVDTKIDAFSAAKRGVEDALRRRRIDGTVIREAHAEGNRIVFSLPAARPRVSVIGVVKNVEQIGAFLHMLREETEYHPHEVLLITTRKARKEVELPEDVTAVETEDGFVISALNLAAQSASGELLCFLSSDLKATNRQWLSEMVSVVSQPGVAGVGGKLTAANGSVLSCGLVLGVNGGVGDSQFALPAGENGYFGRATLLREVSALSRDCMLVRKARFNALGGFSSKVSESISDVEFSLRLRNEGAKLLWSPHAEFTIAADYVPRRMNMIARRSLQNLLSAEIFEDRFYNRNLSVESADYFPAFPPRE